MNVTDIIDAERWMDGCEINTEDANEALDRIEDAVAKSIAELELRLGCCRDASTGKDLLIAALEKRTAELDEALRALACEYEYQVCADEHYDKAMAVANATGKEP